MQGQWMHFAPLKEHFTKKQERMDFYAYNDTCEIIELEWVYSLIWLILTERSGADAEKIAY